jgi:hypothetical protein
VLLLKTKYYLGTSRNHKWITIEQRQLLGQTGVTKSVEWKVLFGTQLKNREKLKQLANIKKIPEILNKLK